MQLRSSVAIWLLEWPKTLMSTQYNLEFMSKDKYVSPQSVEISTAVAITIFNEGEISIFGFMKDLQLNPTYLSFKSLIKRERIKQKRQSYFRKSSLNRRIRRQKLAKERRGKELLMLEGGQSYQSSTFGSVTFMEAI